jgi:signal peptidase
LPGEIEPPSFRVVYTGVSMSPVLQEPDLLEVESYGARRVRPGDVVCFKSPDEGVMVVHRVMAVEGRGARVCGSEDRIRTRGDDNRAEDPVLRAGDVIGRVTTAQRGARRRAIHGGWQGLVVLRCARLGRRFRRNAGSVPRALYHLLAGLGPFDLLLPRSLRPRLVRFDTRYRAFVKLLMGGQAVGHYSNRHGKWLVRRPFGLFVDEKKLPSPESLVQRPQSQ